MIVEIHTWRPVLRSPSRISFTSLILHGGDVTWNNCRWVLAMDGRTVAQTRFAERGEFQW